MRSSSGLKLPVAVVVPTVAGRECALKRCLDAVNAQTARPAEIVAIRNCDSYVSAVRTGIEQTTAEWIAFLDDDAVPEPDWLETLAVRFDDSTVGAVGGRILNFVDGRLAARSYDRGPVARLTWYGKTLSRLHDLPLRRTVADVDFLPGSNMCVRRAALPSIDRRWDEGMAPGFETALFLALRRAGWRVVFDSDAVVAHYPAPRPVHLARGDLDKASYEYSYMVTYSLLRHLPWPRKAAFFAYFMLIGQRRSPGLVLAPWFLLPSRPRGRFRAAWRGKLRGLWEATA
jgi:cellulose synthase/poly-beta-1,6-N-acetylglucosamine synthase-like glycosyltransferase